jgi:hypothetical protein
LVYIKTNENTKNNKSTFYGLFLFLLLCLTLITPYASSSPDGLESVANDFGFSERNGIVLLLEDYGISSLNNNFLSTTLSAVFGIVVIIGVSNIVLKYRKKV